MPTVPLHPALVHVPLGLAFVLPVVAAGLALAVWREVLPRRAWLVAVVLQALLVGGGFLALQTGEGDEKRVAAVVGKSLVEAHEHGAEAFVLGAAVVLGLCLAVLAVPRRAVAAFAAIATAGSLVVVGLAYRTGKAGGELVYSRGAARAFLPATLQGDGAPIASKHRTKHHD
jgi:hypothetical protein